MFRRRAAQLAAQGLRAWQEGLTAGSSCAAHPPLPAAGSSGSSSCSSSGAWLRWRHTSRAGAGAAAAAAGRAARPGTQHAQGAAAAAARGWRVSAWQQMRRQWTDGRGYQHFRGRGRPASAVLHSREARNRAATILAVVGAGGTVVWVSSREEVPYTRRMHAILISPQAEMELGRQTFEQVLAEAAVAGSLLPKNHRATQAVQRVGMRVAKAATDGYGGGFQGHLQGLRWEFAVVDSPQVNAFVVPGGKVVVYTGLLRMVGGEDELAAVLAHEGAHVVARHAAERITQMGALELGRSLVYLLFGLPIPSGPLTAIFFLPNSRKAETEADAIGLQIMSRACYDPSAMVTMFEKMGRAEKAEGGDRIPGFLRTHPHSSDRVKAIRQMLPTAQGLYEMSGCDEARSPLAQFRRVVADWP